MKSSSGHAMSRSSPYGAKWQAARVVYLAEHPCCAMCAQRGVVAAATVVDHVVPHRGDMALFWRRSNWQPLCKPAAAIRWPWRC